MSPWKPLNNKAFMPIPHITIGVFIVSAFLVLAVFTIINDHPMKVDTRIATIATTLYQQIQSVDNAYYEQRSLWYIPSSLNTVSIHMTSHSLIVEETKGNRVYKCTKQSITPWWIHDQQACWTNASSFHFYLNLSYGHDGTFYDPLPANEHIRDELNTLYDISRNILSYNPIQLDPSKAVIIEKCIIYYKESTLESSSENTQSFILIYQ
jgi:hypothetical protein